MILGAGFAGLELATRLSESLADEVRTMLIDQNDEFIFGFSKLDVLFERKAVLSIVVSPGGAAIPTSSSSSCLSSAC